jgi:DNA-binding transcriptional LysR family regulator
MRHNFDLHRLRLLRELKHRGTITAVATAMSYSHSAVSQQLAVLEDELGAPSASAASSLTPEQLNTKH